MDAWKSNILVPTSYQGLFVVPSHGIKQKGREGKREKEAGLAI